MKPAHEILEQAAVEMIERGHTKGTFIDPDGRVCLYGACRVQVERCHDERVVTSAVTPFLMRAINLKTLPEVWNDRPETTEAQAIGVLIEAARLAKEDA